MSKRVCARDGCRKPAHPLDDFCSRLCHEVHSGLKEVGAIAEHEKWVRTHRPGGAPGSTSNVKANIANARKQGAATWAAPE